MKRTLLTACLLSFYSPPSYADKNLDLQKEILSVPQDSKQYLSKANIPKISRGTLQSSFLSKFYKPWNHGFAADTSSILSSQRKILERLSKKKLWGVNLQPTDRIPYLKKRMQLHIFPNCMKRAITVHHASLRVLPDNIPIFNDPSKPGQGFPHDILQDSFISALEPIFVYHQTTYGWSLISDGRNSTGWIETKNLLIVNQKFIDKWKSSKHIVVNSDDTIINTEQGAVTGRFGQLLSYSTTEKGSYVINFPYIVRDTVYIGKGYVDKKNCYEFPLIISSQTLYENIDKLVGGIYGWGGIYGLRDCSSTLKDLYNIFGIFLPRDSIDQSKFSGAIDLKGMNRAQKHKTIIEKAVPGLSILYMPGHVFLYLGEFNQKISVFHNLWGTGNNKRRPKERLIIGKGIVAPLGMIEKHSTVRYQWLDKITKIINLV